MIFQEPATVITNKQIAHETYLTTFRSPKITRAIHPGQFVELASQAPDSILNRPMAVYDVDQKRELLSVGYHVIGANTAHYAELEKGDTLALTGPFGSIFKFNLSYDKYILVGGGIGIASLYLIGKYLKSKKKNTTTLMGARNMAFISCKKDFQKFGPVKIATDDGSRGYKGYVHELLRSHVGAGLAPAQPRAGASPVPTIQVIYCGPVKMMESCAKVCNELRIPHLAVMEEMMACGFGICVACVCQTTEGQKKVCIDGPMFDGAKMVWTREQVANVHE